MDNMGNNEIKQENRKALPKFMILMVICVFIGGVTGYLSAYYGLDEMTGSIKAAGRFFGAQIAPWVMVALAVIVPIICIPVYQDVKKKLGMWDGEDEDAYDVIDGKLSIVLWITSGALVLSYFLIAATYTGGFTVFENGRSTFILFIGVAAFLIIMAEAIIIQQKCVDTVKKANPEKKGSVYDMKFQKKWMDSCDEAEKIVIGKCAFKAYSATNLVCTILAIVLAVSALVFGTGFLPSLMVCLIWIVNLSAYCKEAVHYSKAGNKIS